MLKRMWNRVKGWGAKVKAAVLTFLASLGLIAGVVLADTQNFSFEPPTTRADGSTLTIAEIQEFRLYCDGSLKTTAAGDATTFSADFVVGSHTCYATTVDTEGQESDPSNEVSFVITPARPNPPVLSLS